MLIDSTSGSRDGPLNIDRSLPGQMGSWIRLLAKGVPEKPALGLVAAACLPGTLLLSALPAVDSLHDRRGSRNRGNVFWAACCRRCSWQVSSQPEVSLGNPKNHGIKRVFDLDIDLARCVPRVMAECGLVVGGILLILAVALGLTDYLVNAQVVPQRMVARAAQTIGSRFSWLPALNAFQLLAGCVVEIHPASMVPAPLVAHLGSSFGVRPVHLGIIFFLASMELGCLALPGGPNLYFASYRFRKSVAKILRPALPLFAALATGSPQSRTRPGSAPRCWYCATDDAA